MNIFQGWLFFRSEYFSGVNIFRSGYFSGVNIFQGWIFFRGDYFSRVNIFQGQLVFKEKYFSRVMFFKGWTFFRYTHSLNIWLPHNLPGLVSDYFPFCHSPKSICPLGLLSSGSQCSLSVRMNQCKMLPHKTKIPLRWAVYLKGAQIGGQRIKGRGRNVR